jgi:hypothetical protein
MNPLNPKKQLLTKGTAVTPVAKQKHFLVSRVIQPVLETDSVECTGKGDGGAMGCGVLDTAAMAFTGGGAATGTSTGGT